MINKETMLNLLAEEFGVNIHWEYTNVDMGPITLVEENPLEVMSEERWVEFSGRASAIVLATPYGGGACECSECICDDDKCGGGGCNGNCN